MFVICRQRCTVIFQALIVTHRIGYIIVRLLLLILIQDRVYDLAVGLPVRGEGIAGRPVYLVDILPQGMRTAQLAGIGRTSGIKRFPFADILIGIVVGPLPLRQGGNTALAEEVTKFVLIAALHERPVEEGTQLGSIPVANVIVFETGTGDVVRHIIGDIVVVHRFRIVIFRTPVHIGDISDLPVADVESTVRGKRNLLVGNGLECIDPPALVYLPGESGRLFRRMLSQMGRKRSRQAPGSGSESEITCTKPPEKSAGTSADGLL